MLLLVGALKHPSEQARGHLQLPVSQHCEQSTTVMYGVQILKLRSNKSSKRKARPLSRLLDGFHAQSGDSCGLLRTPYKNEPCGGSKSQQSALQQRPSD